MQLFEKFLADNKFEAASTQIIGVRRSTTTDWKEVPGGSSMSFSREPNAISIVSNGRTVRIEDETPLFWEVNGCIERHFDLSTDFHEKHPSQFVSEEGADFKISASLAIERHKAAERVNKLYASGTMTERFEAEWARFILTDTYAITPCSKDTFELIWRENEGNKHPLPFLETYSHYWSSKRANFQGGQVSDAAIAVCERTVEYAPTANWSERRVLAFVSDALNLHPLHLSHFRTYVAELWAESTATSSPKP